MVSHEEIIQCKNLLQARQLELIQQVQNHYGLTESAAEMTGELSNYDNHPAELGTELFERSKDHALNEHAEKELQAINEALHAIEEGTYGICVKCGREIDFERLQAVPTAVTCTRHPDDQKFTNEHTVEETTFSPNINPGEATTEDEEQVGYDAEDAWQEVSRYGSSDTPSDLYGDQDSYNEMSPNDDEDRGTVETLEGKLMADIHGREITSVTDEGENIEE